MGPAEEVPVTCCVAIMCERRRALVLVADRMLGAGFAEAELRMSKIRPLHPDWYVMIAGNNVGPAFDIIDKSAILLRGRPHTVDEVEETLAAHYRARRMDEANALANPSHELGVQLLTAGFDASGVGHIFTVSNPGLYQRFDIPGFHAIGSGSFGAYYMLLWREVDIYLKASHALYYAFEAKIFGESAPGVGYETDMYVIKHGKRPMKVGRSTEDKMESIWRQVRPREVRPDHRRKLERLKEIEFFKR